MERLQARVADLDAEAATLWEEAQGAVRKGEKPDRLLRRYRSRLLLRTQLARRESVLQEHLGQLEAAVTDLQITQILDRLNGQLEIDPVKLEATLTRSEELGQRQSQNEAIWSRRAEADPVGEDAEVPSLESLGAQLQRETAPGLPAEPAAAAGLSDRLAASRQRLQQLLDQHPES